MKYENKGLEEIAGIRKELGEKKKALLDYQKEFGQILEKGGLISTKPAVGLLTGAALGATAGAVFPLAMVATIPAGAALGYFAGKKISPESLYNMGSRLPYIGERFKKAAELCDPLNHMEEELKGHLNSVETIVLKLGEIAKEKRQEYIQAKEIAEEAERDNWDIDKLRKQIMENADITVDPALKEFFNYTTENLEPEQAEKKKTVLFGQLKDRARILEETDKLMAVVAREGMDVYEYTAMQYEGFMAIKPQIQVTRDAALMFPDSEDMSVYSREYLITLLQKSADALSTIPDTLDTAYKYLISSTATAEEIKEVREGLEARIKQSFEQKVETKVADVKVE